MKRLYSYPIHLFVGLPFTQLPLNWMCTFIHSQWCSRLAGFHLVAQFKLNLFTYPQFMHLAQIHPLSARQRLCGSLSSQGWGLLYMYLSGSLYSYWTHCSEIIGNWKSNTITIETPLFDCAPFNQAAVYTCKPNKKISTTQTNNLNKTHLYKITHWVWDWNVNVLWTSNTNNIKVNYVYFFNFNFNFNWHFVILSLNVNHTVTTMLNTDTTT